QREVKRATKGDVELEYVEVTIDYIALANELAKEVLARGLDELASPVRGLYDELRRVCVTRAEELSCQPDAVLLSRREILEATGWSDWQVRSYCRQLVEPGISLRDHQWRRSSLRLESRARGRR